MAKFWIRVKRHLVYVRICSTVTGVYKDGRKNTCLSQKFLGRVFFFEKHEKIWPTNLPKKWRLTWSDGWSTCIFIPRFHQYISIYNSINIELLLKWKIVNFMNKKIICILLFFFLSLFFFGFLKYTKNFLFCFWLK